MPNQQALIARLMFETDIMTTPMTGMAPDVSMGNNSTETETDTETSFNDDELKLAKQFIEMIGSPERARELLDKCSECLDCLGMIGDEDEAIEGIAGLIPSTPDLPTKTRSFNVAALYNPNAVAGSY